MSINSSLPQLIYRALLSVHSTPPRLISPGPAGLSSTAGTGTSAGRRKASVALIIRIRPTTSPPPSPSSQPTFYSSTTTPHNLSRQPSWNLNQNETSSSSVHSRENSSIPTTTASTPMIGNSTILPNEGTNGVNGDHGRNFLSPPELLGSSLRGVQNQHHQPQDQQFSSSSDTSMNTDDAPSQDVPPILEQFFSQEWVQQGVPEILYIKRASRSGDRWSSHLAFPGGRAEPDDESALYTAMRETWEEVGIDLAEKEFLHIGSLDDREITTSLGKRLLMVLSPFVFLQTSPESPLPDLQPSEVASAHWIPVTMLQHPDVRWSDVVVDISSRLAPKNAIIRSLLKLFVGNMKFKCILLPNEPTAVSLSTPDEFESRPPTPPLPPTTSADLRLWGLTLGMTLDLLSHIYYNQPPPTTPQKSMPYSTQQTYYHTLSPATYPFWTSSTPMTLADSNPNHPPSSSLAFSSSTEDPSSSSSSYPTVRMSSPPPIAPSMTSIFPRFSYPDVNILIWLFGWRYRSLVRSWSTHPRGRTHGRTSTSTQQGQQQTVAGGVTGDARVNWAGMALGSFYAAVRKALVVAVVLRSLAVVGGTATVMFYLRRWLKDRRRRIG